MRYIILIIALTGAMRLCAQHRNANWVFCDSVGYNFITQDTFHTKFSTAMPYWGIECLSTISTESGELLFSCDGTALYQGTAFDTMLNGGGLFGNKSYTNGCVIFPLADYYMLINRRIGGCDYNIIRFDSSLGKWRVFNEEKNIKFIKKSITEQVAAIKHGNGRDWWIISHELNDSNTFV